jgi:hypothetical protein
MSTTSEILKSEISEHEKNWVSCGQGFKHNVALFKKGIIVVKPEKSGFSLRLPSEETQFSLGTRELVFTETTHAGNAKSKKDLLFNQLQNFCRSANGAQTEYTTLEFFNRKRRDEKFSSLVIDEQVGFYLYPWLSTSSNIRELAFSGFKKYVTAGCIYGAAIEGRDQNGFSIGLIKHDIQFFEKQKIVRIDAEERFSSYEEMLFGELAESVKLMKQLSVKTKGHSVELYYHLPYYDYVLYGVELFIRGRITLPALDSFFNAIFSRKLEHENKIRDIFRASEIAVKIESPFENLFGILPATGKSSSYVKFILGKLYLPCKELKLNENEEKRREQEIVKRCLEFLKTNTYNLEHRQIWEDFLAVTGDIATIEELFKIANPVMIACAAKGTGNGETCSLLPVSEKQIQLGYADLSKKLQNREYPAVFNLTTIDPVIAYDNENVNTVYDRNNNDAYNSKSSSTDSQSSTSSSESTISNNTDTDYSSKNTGLLFYFTPKKDFKLANLLCNRAMLNTAHANIARQTQGQKETALEPAGDLKIRNAN